MDTNLVSFIIVSYKVKDLLHQALKSIEENVLTSYEIIVVDNNSEDSTVESLKGKYKNLKVIASKENLGFGAGNNLAYQHARGKYIFFLNPDVIVFDNSIDNMIKYMEIKENVGLVSPKLLYEDGSLQRSIRKFYSYFGSLLDNRFMNPVIARFPSLTKYLPGLVNHSIVQEVDWAKGAALLIRREVLEQVGLFDEQFWIYGEEMDLCYRIGKAGWKKVFLPVCNIIHLEGKSTTQSSVKMFLMNYKGTYLFLKKHFSPFTLKLYHARVWLFIRILKAVRRKNSSKTSLYESLIQWHSDEGRKIVYS